MFAAYDDWQLHIKAVDLTKQKRKVYAVCMHQCNSTIVRKNKIKTRHWHLPNLNNWKITYRKKKQKLYDVYYLVQFHSHYYYKVISNYTRPKPGESKIQFVNVDTLLRPSCTAAAGNSQKGPHVETQTPQLPSYSLCSQDFCENLSTKHINQVNQHHLNNSHWWQHVPITISDCRRQITWLPYIEAVVQCTVSGDGATGTFANPKPDRFCASQIEDGK